ncbi:MAG: hypothetical protein AAB515_04270 [Patescibacteria group bacterium]
MNPKEAIVNCSVCNAQSRVTEENFNGFMPSHSVAGGGALCHGTGMRPKAFSKVDQEENQKN